MADFVGGGFQNSPPPLAGAMSLAQRIIKKRQKRSAQANGGTTAEDNAGAQQGYVEKTLPGPGAATAAPRPRPRKPRAPSLQAQIAANTHQTAVNTGGFSTNPPPPKLWVPGDPK